MLRRHFIFIGMILFASCTPSHSAIQTAIAQTQSALPKSTSTSAATTPTPFLVIVPTMPPTATNASLPSPTIEVIRAGNQMDIEPSVTPTLTQEESDSISWDKAGDYVGKLVTVCGPVMGSHFAKSTNGQPTFLNLGKDYPDPTRFAVLIWGSDRPRFPAPLEQYYLGKTICVRGIISSYQGLVEVEIIDPDQIIIK